MDKNILTKLYAWIDERQDEIIENLCDVASIRSVSDAKSDVKPYGQGCLDVLNKMLEKGKAAAFKTQNFDNYVGSILYETGAAKENTIGVWAHLDVVPEGEGWTMTEPYKPTLKDGLLFGRGVGDNKSAAIGTFYIQQAIRALNIPLKHNIELFLGTSEETGMSDVEYYVAHYPTPKFSLVPDAGFPGVCGEFGRVQYDLVSDTTLSSDIVDLYAGSVFNIIPNKATVVLKKNAELDLTKIPQENFTVTQTEDLVTIEAAGLSRHAAMPEGSINAIYQLTKVLKDLPGLKASDQAIFKFLTDVNEDSYGTFLGFAKTDDISGQTVSSGTVLKVKEGHVYLTNDCRHCVTDTNEHIIDMISKTAAKYQFHLEVLLQSKPAFIDQNSQAVQTISKIYREYTGDEEKEMRIGKGGTYAGKIPMAVATGITLKDEDVSIELPAGHGGAHQPDEYISVKGYMEGIKLLATIILNLDEVL